YATLRPRHAAARPLGPRMLTDAKGSDVDRSADDRLAQLARRQRALLTRAQATSVGYSAAMVRSRLRSGRWQEVAPDVFLLAGAPMDWPTHVLAACLATGGVASHRTAAVLLGVDGF